jgi:hypothetical protein
MLAAPRKCFYQRILDSSLIGNWEEELETWGYFVVKKYFRKERDEVHRLALDA